MVITTLSVLYINLADLLNPGSSEQGLWSWDKNTGCISEEYMKRCGSIWQQLIEMIKRLTGSTLVGR